jgi:hypothetical protein
MSLLVSQKLLVNRIASLKGGESGEKVIKMVKITGNWQKNTKKGGSIYG